MTLLSYVQLYHDHENKYNAMWVNAMWKNCLAMCHQSTATAGETYQDRSRSHVTAIFVLFRGKLAHKLAQGRV